MTQFSFHFWPQMWACSIYNVCLPARPQPSWTFSMVIERERHINRVHGCIDHFLQWRYIIQILPSKPCFSVRSIHFGSPLLGGIFILGVGISQKKCDRVAVHFQALKSRQTRRPSANAQVNAAALANGISTGQNNERTLDLLQRQSALIYKGWKETFLVSVLIEKWRWIWQGGINLDYIYI